MLMLIWNNIARRRTQSVITITITTLTIFVFVMVMGIFQVVTEGLELSRERLGADAILVSHTIVECLDPETPASLSPAVHSYLRNTMGFEGVIVTDDLVMQAITDTYGAGEAAVLAVLAGNDLLCCTAFQPQYEAVLDAVYRGRIDIDTLNNAVRNVLEWKMELGLI